MLISCLLISTASSLSSVLILFSVVLVFCLLLGFIVVVLLSVFVCFGDSFFSAFFRF